MGGPSPITFAFWPHILGCVSLVLFIPKGAQSPSGRQQIPLSRKLQEAPGSLAPCLPSQFRQQTVASRPRDHDVATRLEDTRPTAGTGGLWASAPLGHRQVPEGR